MDARSTIYADANGVETIILVRSVAGATAIQAQTLAVSNADWVQWWENGPVVNLAPAPTAATYLTCVPYAVLSFMCVDNTIVTLRVPAPKLSLFLADGLTVDPSAAASLITACIGSLVNASGSPAASYVGGYLSGIPR